MDTKKKELVGAFKNPGRRWEQEPTLVNDHDFRSQADGMAVPYGIYELQLNRGNVYVGTNADTPQFAAESIARWWQSSQRDYIGAQRLLILADGGGSNGVRCRAWKAFIQTRLVDRYRIPVTVCQYPPGTSKWNPIEHRLFSEISKNWSGQPLDSYETIVKYIRSTKTTTGLRVRASLVKKIYEKGIKISKAQFAALSIKRHDTLAQWNYTLSPR